MEFGDAVRARRSSLGYSLADLSERSGTSRAMLSEIESGKKNPTLRVACSIAMALDCQISDLLDVPAEVRFEKLEGERKRVLIDPHSGVERHLLAPPMVQHGIQVLMFVIPPGQSMVFNSDGAGTIEHSTCISGRIEIRQHGPGEPVSAELGPGESANYASDVEHEIANVLSGQESRVFVVMDASRRGEPAVFGGTTE